MIWRRTQRLSARNLCSEACVDSSMPPSLLTLLTSEISTFQSGVLYEWLIAPFRNPHPCMIDTYGEKDGQLNKEKKT